ncbi:tetratricopeptide repeat protein [Texcoconibacillus texcoconensis]|uniref:Tetratricopeptide (TPR) repeat protein n=1 Tax=Texcoconibacillus texcoconensis TaxID=1095777 RepID=A0A840QQ32_9BACI|nr:tetratricopeptide repeat protein [Texcoconibacillus texcoconensis]MBB5173448.1 tetratricopeptide (TPR) repeat protein [Texcoconibacillus texcoconensis]
MTHNEEPKQKWDNVIPFLKDGAYFYKKGIEAYQNQQVDKALTYIQKAIDAEPHEPIFMCQLAIVLADKGEYDHANEWLKKVLADVDPNMNECYFFMANNLAYLGHKEDAIVRLKQYLQREPAGEYADDANWLLEMLEGEQKASSDEDLQPKNDSVYEQAMLNLERGYFLEAEKHFIALLQENSSDWDTYALLAEAVYHGGDHERAIQIVQDVIIKDETNFLARCQLAVFYHLQGREEASQYRQQLNMIRPVDHEHRYILARTNFHIGAYREAHHHYQKLMKKSYFRKRPTFYHQAALVSWLIEDKQTAEKLWGKAWQLDEVNRDYIEECLNKLGGSWRTSTRDVFYYL